MFVPDVGVLLLPEDTLSDQKAIQLDRRLPVAAQIFDFLRAKIIALELAPGIPLSRPALAESLAVSQTPVRDAVQRLEQEGLVIVHPQSSTLVAPIDITRANETHFLRTALECEVTRTITACTEEFDLRPAELALDEMDTIWIKHHDPLAFRSKDQAFHQALFLATGRERLWELIVHRSGDIDRLRNLHLTTEGKATQILRDHRDILDALMAGNRDGAEAAVRRHLSGTLAAVEEIRKAHPQYFR
jgi:GntR family transcriptional regulator, rspAB operon transcriptional repressor